MNEALFKVIKKIHARAVDYHVVQAKPFGISADGDLELECNYKFGCALGCQFWGKAF